MRHIVYALAVFLITGTMAFVPVQAQETKEAGETQVDETESAQAETEEAQQEKTSNPFMEEIREKGLVLAQTLSKEEVIALGQVREAFGMIRSIQTVADTVEDAVKACAAKNEGLADDIQDRFAQWDETVGGAVEMQAAKLDSYVSTEYFEDPAAIQDYLDLIDKAAGYAKERLDTRPVTTKSACRKLMKSMDRTDKQLTDLLQNIVWPDEQDEAGDSESQDAEESGNGDGAE